MARQVKPKSRFSPQNYYRTPPTERPNPSREQRRQDDGVKRRRLGRVIRIALLLVTIWSLWYFGTVNGIRVESNATSDQNQALMNQLEPKLSGWRSIKPFINSGQLAQQLQQADGSIAQLKLSWSLGSRQLYANAIFRQPVALAVAGNARLGLIGQDGVYYRGETQSDLAPIEDSEGITPAPGQQFVPVRVLDFIRLVEQSLEQLPQDIQTSRRYQLVESSREVYLASNRPFVVKLNIERSAADQMQELAETLDWLKQRKRVPADYIDLRLDDTAYYR